MKFYPFILVITFLLLCYSFSQKNKHQKPTYKIIQSDTALIKKAKYVLTVYRNDTSIYFTVQREVAGKFKIILKDLDYSTNNSDIDFEDANNDGLLDIVWLKKWQAHCYLFNPQIDNFVEVGEFDNVDTLKANNTVIFYQEKFPLLFNISYEKLLTVAKCGEDTMMSEVHSELYIINEKYQKVSFATLDNFSTFDSIYHDTLSCGSQIMECYVPPYYGKYGPYNIWNSGKVIDSFLLNQKYSLLDVDTYNVDSSFIANYWIEHYPKLLQYGQVFKVRREKPLLYYQ
jgi:hypothetical protein